MLEIPSRIGTKKPKEEEAVVGLIGRSDWESN